MKNEMWGYILCVLWSLSVPLLAQDQAGDDLSKKFQTVSVFYSVPDDDKQHFADVVFRFGWNSQPPYVIGLQFSNRSYEIHKLKFAIKDVTTGKTVVLDPVRNTAFGMEVLEATSPGKVWSGTVDDVKDSFVLKVWDEAEDEFDKVPISITDQQ